MPLTYEDNSIGKTCLLKPDRYTDEIWTPWSDNTGILNRMVGGHISIAQGDANYTLLDTSAARESRTLALKFTTTLTAARDIKIDTTTSGKYSGKLFIIWNASSANFKLTIKTTAGGSTGVDINSGFCRAVWHDGTNVYAAGPEVVPTTGAIGSSAFGAPAWTNLSLSNSWVTFGGSYPTPGYTKIGGIVYLRGLIKDGTATDGTVMFNLPAGYRPGAQILKICLSNGAVARMLITTGGDVQIHGGSNAYVSLFDTIVPAEA